MHCPCHDVEGVERCSGCGQLVGERDCGCPAGTYWTCIVRTTATAASQTAAVALERAQRQ